MAADDIVTRKPLVLVLTETPDEFLAPDDGRERAFVPFIAGVAECNDRIELLCPRVYEPDEQDYARRTVSHCVLRADAVIDKILAPLGAETGIVHIHNHPGGVALFSSVDDAGLPDKLIAVRTRKPDAWFVRGVVGIDGMRFEAFAPGASEPVPVDLVKVITRDRGIEQIVPANAWSAPIAPVAVDPELHARTIGLLGADAHVLDALGRVRVGFVGFGGTASALAAQLPYLNVRQMTLVDDDLLERSNRNRWVLAQDGDEGRPKVEVGRERLLEKHPEMTIRAVQARFPAPEAVDALKSCHLILSCPDNDWTRYEVAQFAARYMKVCITLGSGVAVNDTGTLRALGSQMRVFIPGDAGRCESCQGLDLTRLSPPELERRHRVTGYTVSRSVVTINSAIASLTAGWLLHWFRGQWADVPTYLQYDELSLAVHDLSRMFLTNDACPTCGMAQASLLGRGDHWRSEELLGSPQEAGVAYGCTE